MANTPNVTDENEYKATEEALTNLDEAQRRGAAARQRVATNFGVEAMILAWEKILVGKQMGS